MSEILNSGESLDDDLDAFLDEDEEDEGPQPGNVKDDTSSEDDEDEDEGEEGLSDDKDDLGPSDKAKFSQGKILGRYNTVNDLAKSHKSLESKFTKTSMANAELVKFARENGRDIDPKTGKLVPISQPENPQAQLQKPNSEQIQEQPDTEPIPEFNQERPFWLDPSYKPDTRYQLPNKLTDSEGNELAADMVLDRYGVPVMTRQDWDSYRDSLAANPNYQDEDGNPEWGKITARINDERWDFEQQRKELVEVRKQQEQGYKQAESTHRLTVGDKLRAKEFPNAEKALHAELKTIVGFDVDQAVVKPILDRANKIIDDAKRDGVAYYPGVADMAINLAIAEDRGKFLKGVVESARKQAPTPKGKQAAKTQDDGDESEEETIVITDGRGRQQAPVNNGKPAPVAIPKEVRQLAKEMGIKEENISKLMANTNNNRRGR